MLTSIGSWFPVLWISLASSKDLVPVNAQTCNLTAVPLGSDARNAVGAVWKVVPIHVSQHLHQEKVLYQNKANLLHQASISKPTGSILASILSRWMGNYHSNCWIGASTNPIRRDHRGAIAPADGDIGDQPGRIESVNPGSVPVASSQSPAT